MSRKSGETPDDVKRSRLPDCQHVPGCRYRGAPPGCWRHATEGSFIWRAEEVPARLACFDFERDVDGRFSVNKCYCHDSTWQEVLAALARRCDVVLMDLRGFQAHNTGCVHELGVLARSRARVVALTDARTDQAAAQQAAGAPDGQFTWLQAGEHSRGRVLQALFNATTDRRAMAQPAIGYAR